MVSSPLTVQAFLQAHLRALAKVAEVTVVADSSDGRFLLPISRALKFHRMPIRRAIEPLMDSLALLKLTVFFRKQKFDLVHSYTPKAGLLAMTAAFFAGVSQRIHTFTGQVWATKRGFFRHLLKNLDRLTARMATHILVDSSSQMRFLRSERVLPRGTGNILGKGSVSGVDLKRFRPNPSVRKKLRRKMGLAKEAIVFLFVGRLKRDKGIPELYEAFNAVRAQIPSAYLLLVGPKEENIPTPAKVIGAKNGVIYVGPSSKPENYMAVADVLVLPSHREGFGTTVIEANACGIPVVASRIYGLKDAVVNGQTGILISRGKVTKLTKAMVKIGTNTKLRRRMGITGLKRVKTNFDQNRITFSLLRFYKKKKILMY